jgi:hypothetical protein
VTTKKKKPAKAGGTKRRGQLHDRDVDRVAGGVTNNPLYEGAEHKGGDGT